MIIYLNIVFLRYFTFKILNLFYCLIVIISFHKCIDPTVPEFQFAEDLMFIDGFITDKPKGSYVSVKKSKLEFGIYKTFPIASNKLSVTDTSRTNDAIASQTLFYNSIKEGRYLLTIDYSVSSGDFDLGIGNFRLFLNLGL